MKITLPLHRLERLEAILSAITWSQCRIVVDKWNQVLGDLRSMAIALPGARYLFSQIQEALCHVKEKRVTLSKVVHEALVDLRWLAENVSNLPTRIYKIVPLRPTVNGYHDASSYMCGSVVLLGSTVILQILPSQPSTARPPPNPIAAHPIV